MKFTVEVLKVINGNNVVFNVLTFQSDNQNDTWCIKI